MSETLSTKKQTNDILDGRMLENSNRNAEADRRLNALETTITDYEKDHDFIVGATVFGSTMHGEAHAKSDVDAMIFVDPDILSQQVGEDFDEQDYKDMAGVVQNDLVRSLGLQHMDISSGKRNDIRMLPINDRLINEQITAYEDANNARSEEDPYPSLDWNITALFHPVVGESDAITKMRSQVVDRIKQSKQSQEIWDEVVRRVWFFEGDMHNEESKIPEIFDDVVKTYEIEAA